MKLVKLRLIFSVLLAMGALSPATSFGETYEAGLDALFSGNKTKALSTWKILAARGDARAQYHLARLYELDSASDEKNPERAIEWFRASAEQGFAAAQNRMGELTAQGIDGAADPVAAVGYWRSAAEQGDSAAQYNLGLAHFRGEGIEEDAGMAERWLRLAADGGYAQAQYVLGQMRNEGLLLAQSQGLALAWYLRASDNGHAEAAAQVRALVAAGVSPLVLPEPTALPDQSGQAAKESAQKLAAVEIENAALGELLDSAEKKNSLLAKNLTDTQERLAAETEKTTAEVAALKLELTAVAEKAEAFETAAEAAQKEAAQRSDELKATQDETAQLQARLNAAETESAAQLEELALAQKEIAALSAQVATGNEGAANIAKTLAAAQTENEKLSAELQANVAAAAKQLEALTSAERKVAELQSEVSEMKQDLAATDDRHLAETNKLADELTSARDEIARLSASKSALEESLKGAEDSAQALIAGLEKKVQASDEEASRVSAAAKLWEEDAVQKQVELVGLREELAMAREKFTSVEGDLTDLKGNVEILRAEHEQERAAARQEIGRYEETVKTARADMVAQAKRMAVADAQIAELTVSLKSAEEALRSAKDTQTQTLAVRAAPPQPAEKASAAGAATTVAAIAKSLDEDPNLKRGGEYLALGDIASARLFYELSMDSGNVKAATELGKTYDPLYLRSLKVVGALGRPEKAKEWYELAIGAGDQDAIARLKALQDWEQQ